MKAVFGTCFLAIFGLTWAMPIAIKDAYGSWCKWRVGKSIKKIWSMVLASNLFGVSEMKGTIGVLMGISTPVHILKAKCLMNLVYSVTKEQTSSKNCSQLDTGA